MIFECHRSTVNYSLHNSTKEFPWRKIVFCSIGCQYWTFRSTVNNLDQVGHTNVVICTLEVEMCPPVIDMIGLRGQRMQEVTVTRRIVRGWIIPMERRNRTIVPSVTQFLHALWYGLLGQSNRARVDAWGNDRLNLECWYNEKLTAFAGPGDEIRVHFFIRCQSLMQPAVQHNSSAQYRWPRHSTDDAAEQLSRKHGAWTLFE